jgi:hypothetical protein
MVEKTNAKLDADADARTELTWHKNNGGFPLKPVVGGNILHVLNRGSFFLNQQGPATDTVNGGTERLQR